MSRKKCKTCRSAMWDREAECLMCSNEGSDYFVDHVDDDHCCDEYEEVDDEE